MMTPKYYIESKTLEYEKREARQVSHESPHYPFYCALKDGGKVWRNDRLNGVQEWLTLEHPGIQGNACNIVYFGWSDLFLYNYCRECGAKTPKEAEMLCVCGGDKDHCQGCELWPN